MSARIDNFLLAASRLLSAPGGSEVDQQLAREWPPDVLAELLGSDRRQVVRLACRALGRTGEMSDTPLLVPLLGSEDAAIVGEAENALWQLWMLAEGPMACGELNRAMRAAADEPAVGVEALRDLVARRPTFAEAHHQLAVALHGLERVSEADAHYAQALLGNPWHYAAAAARGHLAVERSDWTSALHHYQQALQIHPGLTEIAELVPQLAATLARRVVA